MNFYTQTFTQFCSIYVQFAHFINYLHIFEKRKCALCIKSLTVYSSANLKPSSWFILIYSIKYIDCCMHLGLAELKCRRNGDAAVCDRSQSPNGAKHRGKRENRSRVSEPVLPNPGLSNTSPGRPAATARSEVQRCSEGAWYFITQTYRNASRVSCTAFLL